MFRVGDDVCHFMSMNKVGKIIEIEIEKGNSWLVGGTSDTAVMLIVKYPDGSINKINSGDARKIY